MTQAKPSFVKFLFRILHIELCAYGLVLGQVIAEVNVQYVPKKLFHVYFCNIFGFANNF